MDDKPRKSDLQCVNGRRASIFVPILKDICLPGSIIDANG